jgi:hypothetical protein
MQQPTLNLKSLVEKLSTTVPNEWKRKDFKDFDYLKVEPSKTAIILTWLLTLISTIGTIFWAINNEY